MTTPSGDSPEEREETGAVREPAPAPEVEDVVIEVPDDAGSLIDGQVEQAASADSRVIELTSDLQRVTAEYANYRKRVDRDREAVRELAVAAVLNELLPVLDDVELARQHGELSGAFKSVGEALEATTTRIGLERFGTAGEPFDPSIHEALTHAEAEGESPEGPVCTQIYQPGYRINDRVIRPARVAVTE